MSQTFGNVPWESIGLAFAVVAGALTFVLAALMVIECIIERLNRWRGRR